MGVYKLSFRPSVEKDLRHLPASASRLILKRIEQISTNPISPKAIKLAGSHNLYRLRVGDYRVVYSADHHAQEVMIHYVRHRREVYRSL